MFAFMPMNHEFGNCLSTPMLNSHFAFCLQVFHQAGPPKQDLGNNATRGFCRQAAWGVLFHKIQVGTTKMIGLHQEFGGFYSRTKNSDMGQDFFQKVAAFGEKHF